MKGIERQNQAGPKNRKFVKAVRQSIPKCMYTQTCVHVCTCTCECRKSTWWAG